MSKSKQTHAYYIFWPYDRFPNFMLGSFSPGKNSKGCYELPNYGYGSYYPPDKVLMVFKDTDRGAEFKARLDALEGSYKQTLGEIQDSYTDQRNRIIDEYKDAVVNAEGIYGYVDGMRRHSF